MNKTNKHKLISTLFTLNISMAATLFILRTFTDETRLAVTNFIPLLFSGAVGALLSVVFYLSVKNVFHQQLVKSPFLASIVPAISVLMLLIMTGVDTFWLIDPLLLMLSFMMSLQQVAKAFDTEQTATE